MDRFLLTLAVLAVFGLAVFGMWLGWRRKAREQSGQYDPFPQIPEDLAGPGLAELTGIYVATTPEGRWQERIVAHGLGMRGRATLRRYDSGVAVERHGSRSFFIPAESIVDAHTERRMAGKVMGTPGLLVITWRLDGVTVDTGFRGDDRMAYSSWISALSKEAA